MDILHAHVSQISETDQGCQYETDENRKKVHQPKAVDLQDFIALIHIYMLLVSCDCQKDLTLASLYHESGFDKTLYRGQNLS